jgi:hypothetical protein
VNRLVTEERRPRHEVGASLLAQLTCVVRRIKVTKKQAHERIA